MNLQKTNLLRILAIVSLGIFAGSALAAEVLIKEDFIQKVVTEKQLVKTVDNFIVLFDTSSSTGKPFKGTDTPKREIAKSTLKERNAFLPNLGYNAGLYLYTPFKEIYPVQAYDRQKFSEAIDQLPDTSGGPTLLMQALIKLEPILKNLSGRTAVFIVSDGNYTKMEGFKEPEQKAKELSAEYSTCFYYLSNADTEREKRNLMELAKGSECSRVIPFEFFVDRLEYMSGALFVVRANTSIVTMTDKKVAGLKVDNIQFGFDASKVEEEYYDELDQVAAFLKQHPEAYAVIDGYTDPSGDFEYNMRLSRRRAESVAEYLMYKYGITEDRLVVLWFGAVNPVAANDTEEGRAKNRRVEIAVGGLE
ncbi:MAG: OmpA family protein [Desulfobacterales bacterium]|nr:MAG: OmpA family protein [Desulfobacterales bacterium]